MGTGQRGEWVKNEALNAFSSLRFHLEENGAKYFQLSSLMRFQKYLFSVSSDDVSVFTSMRFHLSTPETMRCVFKRLHKASFSSEFSDVLVWMKGENASKCMRFQTKTH